MADSGLIFNPETGLHAPDTADIRAAVAADGTAAFADPEKPPLDTEAVTPAGQLVDSETAIIEDKNAQVLYLANQFNPKVADGRWQDGLGHIYFIERQMETPSLVTLTLTGLVAGSAVTILAAGTETVRATQEENAGTTYAYTYETPESVDIAVYNPGYMPFFIRDYSLGSSNASLPYAQVADVSYLA